MLKIQKYVQKYEKMLIINKIKKIVENENLFF